MNLAMSIAEIILLFIQILHEYVCILVLRMNLKMLQAIVGFHLDEENHWVAELACGHGQHVRHDPPWQNRPWVMTESGRREKLGIELDCKKCEETQQSDKDD